MSGLLGQALDGVATLIEQLFYRGHHVFGTNVGERGSSWLSSNGLRDIGTSMAAGWFMRARKASVDNDTVRAAKVSFNGGIGLEACAC